MKIYSKLGVKIRNNKTRIRSAIGIVTVAIGLRYRRINSISNSSVSNSTTQVERLHSYMEEDLQIIDTNDKIIKTGSGDLINNQQICEASKYALRIRSGDLNKSGPGVRAKADARRNAGGTKSNSGSSIIPGADAFIPHNNYCLYHENKFLSCRTKVKGTSGPSPDDGSTNPPPPENGNFDASKYKGGPSPFEDYQYQDLAVVAQNIGFNQPNRLNKSYDKYAEECFGIVQNRNKETLEIFKADITNTAQSYDQVYKGSYRYNYPAYIFLKEIIL